MKNIKRILMCAGFIFTGVALVSGCHTVEGTVKGAGQDIQAVSNTLDTQPKQVHYHQVKKHKAIKRTRTVTQTTVNQAQDANTKSSMQENEMSKSY